ncbi:nucleocapsid [Laibin virus]|uniref:Nucleoprotein n=1 Tax=Laibin virus TaxID=1633187 RepID=A0A0D5W3A1_9VIRU|nr:nucleocapsid [Laibin virus]AJZ68870.1 nucleocapsid [Laibin virus]ASZ85272.1 nucleocapside protein [Laibin virus]
MASIADLRKEMETLEKEVSLATAKLTEARANLGIEPDEIDLKSVKQREDTVAKLKEKLKEVSRQLAEKTVLDTKPVPPKTGKDLDDDEHLKERSTLRYGNVIDLNELDVDEPAGASANWLEIVMYIVTFPTTILLKALYMLTTRGRQTIKENKGNRVRFRDDSAFVEKGGIKVPRHLYISLPTGQASMKAEEVTPGRYRTVVSGLYAAEAQARKLISPVMGVVGFSFIAEKWEELTTKFMIAPCPFLEGDVQAGDAQKTNAAYFQLRDQSLRSSRHEELLKVYDTAKEAGCKLVTQIQNPIAPWVFAGAPDRCPPTAVYVAGMMELGAFFAILQDIRNTIMASKLVGTAEEKLKRQSTFYQSYLRRTQSMGVQLDQRIIILYMINWGKFMVDHFHLGDDMDSDLRKLCQGLIDDKVKQISNQEPLRI